MGEAINYDDYTVAWMCFDELVETALLFMLDEEHGTIRSSRSKLKDVIQQFIFGRASELGFVVYFRHPNLSNDQSSMFDLKSWDDLPDRVNESVIRKGDVVVSNLSDDGSLEYLRGGPLDESLRRIDTHAEPFGIYQHSCCEPGNPGPQVIITPNTKGFGMSQFGDGTLQGLVWVIGHLPSLLIQGVTDNCKADDSLGYPAATVAACARQITTELFASKQLLPTRIEDTLYFGASGWLTPSDFTTRHPAYIKQRFPGTWLSVLSSEKYRSWLLSPNRNILVCTGKEGIGKTIMASTIIQTLQDRFREDTTTGVAYVYLGDLPTEQGLPPIILSLFQQLAQSLSDVHTTLIATHAHLPAADDLAAILQGLDWVVARFSRLWIILDGINHCPPDIQSELFKKMLKLQENHGLKLLLTTS
ncbi:hypothetical protein QC761_0108950 [Podospora bellae-mahoneyi]|uniref:Nephrocystin 3-like N-terminal domain-containing protein n=1 Tax=Podospora bellae-mahoneyi TaxID=2093777 RepID=A0ABR0F7Z8_9PEZI|nr:hypothetical protein QC761_0108950 [Podospora bellae-mahoneyi]